MLNELKMYSASCDKCGKEWQEDNSAWNYHPCKDHIKSNLALAGWEFEKETGSALCEKCKKIKMKELIENVIKWADEKGLLSPENAPKQYLKIVEELGETCQAILKNRPEEIKDGLGDVMVTLIIYAEQMGINYDWGRIINIEEEFVDCFNEVRYITHLLSRDNISECFKSVMNLCFQFNLTPKYCLESAWNEIKDRKGRTINGTFIKESDFKTSPKDI